MNVDDNDENEVVVRNVPVEIQVSTESRPEIVFSCVAYHCLIISCSLKTSFLKAKLRRRPKRRPRFKGPKNHPHSQSVLSDQVSPLIDLEHYRV
jgi:hypothetical protein